MARAVVPWFRADRGWFVTLDGKQISLGIKDKRKQADAFAALQTLLAAMEREAAPPVTVAEAVKQYLDRAADRVGAKTLDYYTRHLDGFRAGFGAADVRELDPATVEQYGRDKGWSAATRRGFLQTVEACLRAAGVEKWKTTKPPKRYDTTLVDERTYWMLVGASRGDFRGYLQVLWHTGARPSEVAGLTVAGVDWPNKLAALSTHKTAHRGKPRTIHFPDAAMAVLEKHRAKYQAGALFRNEAGGQLDAYQAGRRLWRICERLGVKATLYGLRRSFVTEALANGVPDAHVAELVGHAGTAMIHRHYSFLGQRSKELKESAAKARSA